MITILKKYMLIIIAHSTDDYFKIIKLLTLGYRFPYF